MGISGAAVAAAVEQFRGVDIAIANAGSPRMDAPRAYFRALGYVNLLGVWRTVRACLPPIAEIMA